MITLNYDSPFIRSCVEQLVTRDFTNICNFNVYLGRAYNVYYHFIHSLFTYDLLIQALSVQKQFYLI